jgi:uncharacterized membrane protein (DUF2068 family)
VALSSPANGIVNALERWGFLAPFAQRDIDVDVVASAITILGVVIAVGLWRLKRWAWVAAMLWTGSVLAARPRPLPLR